MRWAAISVYGYKYYLYILYIHSFGFDNFWKISECNLKTIINDLMLQQTYICCAVILVIYFCKKTCSSGFYQYMCARTKFDCPFYFMYDGILNVLPHKKNFAILWSLTDSYMQNIKYRLKSQNLHPTLKNQPFSLFYIRNSLQYFNCATIMVIQSKKVYCVIV